MRRTVARRPIMWVVVLVLPALLVGLLGGGCGSRYGATASTASHIGVSTGASDASSATFTTDTLSTVSDTSPESMLAEVRSLLDDLDAGRIASDWSLSPPVDAMMIGDGTGDARQMLLDLQTSLERDLAGPQISAFITDAAAAGLQAFADEVAAWPGVVRVEAVTKEEAMIRFKRDLADHPEIVDGIQGNPLPASLEIRVKDSGWVEPIVARLQSDSRVDESRYGGQVAIAGILALIRSHVRQLSPSPTD